MPGVDKDPDVRQIGSVGLTVGFPATEMEAWCYLPEDAVIRLRDACNSWLALDATDSRPSPGEDAQPPEGTAT